MDVGGMVHAALRDIYCPATPTQSYWDHEREERRVSDEILFEADRLTRAYRNRYIRDEHDEEWQILATELPISFPVFTQEIPVTYSGTADLLVRRTTNLGAQLWVPDHKTSASLSSTIILHYIYSPQMQGYIAAIQHGLTEKIEGACINLIVKTKDPQFHREYTPVNEVWMQQWEEAMKSMVSSLVFATLDYYISNKASIKCFPQNRYECVPYIGSECPFRLVCWHSNGKITNTVRSAYRVNEKRVTYEQAKAVDDAYANSFLKGVNNG
jgi:hypothetical protein